MWFYKFVLIYKLRITPYVKDMYYPELQHCLDELNEKLWIKKAWTPKLQQGGSALLVEEFLKVITVRL